MNKKKCRSQVKHNLKDTLDTESDFRSLLQLGKSECEMTVSEREAKIEKSVHTNAKLLISSGMQHITGAHESTNHFTTRLYNKLSACTHRHGHRHTDVLHGPESHRQILATTL